MQIAKKVVSLSAKIYKLYSYGNNDIHSKTVTDENSPSICCNVNKAREEYANGETISCSTPEDMQRYFDSL